jgi:carboxylate-amine ligase
VDDVVDELGSRHELENVRWILRNGTGADRQLAVYRETGDLKTVMDFVARETEHGLDLDAPVLTPPPVGAAPPR